MVNAVWTCPKRPSADDRFLPDEWEEGSKRRWVPGKKIPAESRTRKPGDENNPELDPHPTTEDMVVVAWQEGWLEDWPVPPAWCTYCGGTHPAGVMGLLRTGWEPEFAKPGKMYLHPPGHKAAVEAIMQWLKDEGQHPPAGHDLWQQVKSPVPPVKVYFNHFDDRQLKIVKKLIDG